LYRPSGGRHGLYSCDGALGVAGISATILGCEGPRLSEIEADFFAQAQPWGFILFARNIETPEQVHRLTSDLRAALGRDAPILIDQEGGRVQRLRAPHWREWRPALDEVMGLRSDQAARALYLRGALIGAELRAIGIDTNCAPLADVARDETHPVLLNRLYGRDPNSVARNARAMANGLLAAGVLPVLKHLPGYGLGQVDSHAELPRVSASRAELEAVDFAAFIPLADLPLGMSAHIVYDAIEDGLPATMSKTLMDLVRNEIGFKGLMMTDDLSMGALPGPIGARAARSIAAGCDLILHCNGDRAEMEAVVANSGALEGAALAQAEAALALRHAPVALDISALQAEFEALHSKAP